MYFIDRDVKLEGRTIQRILLSAKYGIQFIRTTDSGLAAIRYVEHKPAGELVEKDTLREWLEGKRPHEVGYGTNFLQHLYKEGILLSSEFEEYCWITEKSVEEENARYEMRQEQLRKLQYLKLKEEFEGKL